jgi:hypothetical protein
MWRMHCAAKIDAKGRSLQREPLAVFASRSNFAPESPMQQGFKHFIRKFDSRNGSIACCV